MANKEKSAGEKLQEALLYKPENSGILMDEKEIDKAYALGEKYKAFMDACKTEREAVDHTVELLEGKGYAPFEAGRLYQAGDKVYINNRGKAVMFATIGKKPVAEGVKIIASHIDSPRLDLKPRPLYEEAQLAMLKTHYYGGVRKYQWVAMPLALHGVIVKKDGSAVKVAIGEKKDDPVFTINDLLPHLAREQNQRKLNEGIKGEELNVLVGSLPFKDDKSSEKVKLNILKLLNEQYGVVEGDLVSAELCLVPAFKAADIGLDRSMVGAYGHDDRVCAFATIRAALDVKNPDYTLVSILADKEEVGSDGNTGLQSRFLEYFIHDLAQAEGVEGRAVLSRSECLSADVSAAFDPTFASVNEKNNAVYISYGACVMKYVGSGGKGGTNDASAEFLGKLRRQFDDAGVIWQIGELGKVDAGGGGTVAKYVSNLGVEVIDIGVPVLSMHSPFEVIAKTDLYNLYKAFKAFWTAKE